MTREYKKIIIGDTMPILLETERLIIKTPEASDLEHLYALQTDPDVMKYIFNGIRTREQIKEKSDQAILHYQKHGFGAGSVYEKSTQNFIGRAGLFYLAYDDSQPEIELGYSLHKQFWNRGYATEIAKAFLAWGFKNLPVTKLVAVINPKNDASRHVLEKAGMHYVGRVHCYDTDVDKFEIE